MNDTKSMLEKIDNVVRGLLPGYLARRREELHKLKELLALERYEDVRLIGHNLSGSGGAYGLPPLTDIGRELETHAAAENSADIEVQLQTMAAFLDQIDAELQS